MGDVTIRKAIEADTAAILSIYRSAKQFMRRMGNMTQWAGSYPGEKEIAADIENGNLHVGVDDDGEIVVAFAFIIGRDPTYDVIDGAWLNDEPYGTIHRIASSGKVAGMVAGCVEYCFSKVDNIRVDTHSDNRPMLAALERARFTRCGTIICADGTPRVAFHRSGH
ncbi:MAG: GNAT family N-acetyltransferase [Muribaculaceae bacterium]|nr:GNAT family N-acetyltransferase [Muribaculaceae bacterium]